MSNDLPVKWGDAAQFRAAPIEHNGAISVYLLETSEHPLRQIAAMCRMYKGIPTYNLSDITLEDAQRYFDEVQRTHLKAPLEAVSMHFFIEGVDRAFTHQMVRQRTAAYAQESLRFAVKDNLSDEVQMPRNIKEGSDEAKAWHKAINAIDEAYMFLVNNGVPAEDARGLLPNATPTRLHYVTNLRALLDHAGNRLCTQAQFVWREVFTRIIWALSSWSAEWKYIINETQVFKPVCFQLGHCPFTASFDRGCTIRDRVQAGKFDDISIGEWMLDREAGRTKADG